MAAENNGGTLGTKISADFFVLEYSFFSRSYFSMRSVLVTACGCAVRKGKNDFHRYMGACEPPNRMPKSIM